MLVCTHCGVPLKKTRSNRPVIKKNMVYWADEFSCPNCPATVVSCSGEPSPVLHAEKTLRELKPLTMKEPEKALRYG